MYFGEHWNGSRDLHGILDIIRFSKERDKLLTLVRNDHACQEMDEAAYDIAAEYANAEDYVQKYWK